MKMPKRYRLFGAFAIPAVSLAIFALAVLPTFSPAKALGQVYTVTNTGDNNGVNPAPGAGTGTLRQAIVDANANPTLLNGEPHNIQFNIPNADPANPSVQTISLQAALPAISQPTIIDGTTQAGSSCGNLIQQDADGMIASTNTPHSLKVRITTAVDFNAPLLSYPRLALTYGWQLV